MRSVALEALGAGVPRQNMTLGIQHEYRIISNALDEELETLFALPQFFTISLICQFHAP